MSKIIDNELIRNKKELELKFNAMSCEAEKLLKQEEKLTHEDTLFLSEYFVLECKLIDMNDYINTLIKLEQKHKKENKIAKKVIEYNLALRRKTEKDKKKLEDYIETHKDIYVEFLNSDENFNNFLIDFIRVDAANTYAAIVLDRVKSTTDAIFEQKNEIHKGKLKVILGFIALIFVLKGSLMLYHSFI
ncbi:TPA: hypothetical protein JG825_001215 [Vibrio parahaemolyticus]|uniref:hypothetical protein n=1 Tax=Vibrio parahaemolyticus TaxID=670 RepID=UPI00206839D2|nr:hypothetical protein [Vibrio parahaemolyticus]UPR18597.1 hypothetical protein H9J99_19440 [Vibrio parahaemolyticus]UPR22961.1 hypothetical protein H9J98_16460 [Vibrio parahaemolyticus]HAV1517941.1 hypothetical protein [Vibrio parahaemolyticus]HAV1536907.1 hypothetical protein [Vibrio parahaemolyticus]